MIINLNAVTTSITEWTAEQFKIVEKRPVNTDDRPVTAVTDAFK